MGTTWLTVVLFGLVMFLIGGNVALWQITANGRVGDSGS